MKNGFERAQDLSFPSVSLQNRDPELSPRQSEIYRNLEAIGPEIAAFYLSGVKVLQNDDLETSSYLLAHIAREIDGGLRDVLSGKQKEELEFNIKAPDGHDSTFEKGRTGTFEFVCYTLGTFKITYDRIGRHKPSILQSLGIDTPSPLAERWLEVTGKFHKFAHRRGAWKEPRERENFVPLWNEFDDVLADLVGNYLNFLITVLDRILACQEPTDEIRGVLPNLLKSEMRCKYFFENLDSPAWLEPLREDGWFDPKSNISVRHSTVTVKSLDWFDWWKPLMDAELFDPESSLLTKAREQSSKTDTVAPWYALEYVERIAEHTRDHPCDEIINMLVGIVDTVVGCPTDTREKIIKDSTLSQRMIKIISALPEDRRTDKHTTFAESVISAWKDRNKDFMRHAHDAQRLIESIEQNTNLVLREWLSNMSRSQRIEFLEEAPEIVDKVDHLTEQGLANIYREYVVVILQRLISCLRVYDNDFSFDQHSALSGLLTALQDRRQFDWEALLRFCHGILSLEHFWNERQENRLKYKNQIIADIAELIAAGTNDDPHGFDSQFLPLAEQILLVLVEKAESKCAFKKNPMSAFMNSSKGMVFWAIMMYTLRFARTNHNQQTSSLWPEAIKTDFTKRLDKNIESSFEFSFMLGFFLPNLFYLDQKWVVDNIDRIFPQQDEHHWYVAFSMYLISSRKICKSLYFFLEESGHYQKALNTNYAHRDVETALATHICTFWLENYEKLDDNTSLIYQVVNSSNSNFLSAIVDFFWDQRDNLSEEDKEKVRTAWRVMFKFLSENKDEKKYSKVLDVLSKWVIFIDSIDEETLAWLKLSARHVTWDIRTLVNTLLTHASNTPTEVGIIYLELSKRVKNMLLGSFLGQDEVIETIRILYNSGQQETANQICIQFAEGGFDFLKPLYNEYQH